jgi:glycosyltransferase involved in cell wall biosynthesis
MGRCVRAKGIDIAVDVAERAGKRLVIAGPKDPHGGISGGGYRLPRRAEYVGIAGLDQRRELLAGARAVLCPSRYVEPFCGVHCEAMLSGTPAITSDWGAFAEYNIHRQTGFRCRNLRDFVRAVDRLDEIDPARCREWAEARFEMNRVGRQYELFLSGINR